MLLSHPGSAAAAEGLARALGCAHSQLDLHAFPDGETRVRLGRDVAGARVVLVASLDRADRKLLPLLFAADAAREQGAVQVGLAAPYLGYMRQDTRFQPDEAVSARTFARLLASGFDFLATVDPHLHRIHDLGALYPIPARAVAAAPAVAGWVRDNVRAPLLVGPDEESAQWVERVAGLTGAPWTVLSKQRAGDRSVSVAPPRVHPLWQDRSPVLLDDVASTGETLAAAARAFAAAGHAQCTCVVVHALLDAQAEERLKAAGVARLASCDTVAHPSNAIAVAPLLAAAVAELAAQTPLRSRG